MPIERVMLKLALDKKIVDAAKKAAEAKFRPTVDLAVERHLAEIERLLETAGFTAVKKRPKGKKQLPSYRVWPVSITTLETLDAVAERRAIPRSAIIKALLTRMARADTAGAAD